MHATAARAVFSLSFGCLLTANNEWLLTIREFVCVRSLPRQLLLWSSQQFPRLDLHGCIISLTLPFLAIYVHRPGEHLILAVFQSCSMK
jgi:hypothetical protein